MAVRREMKRALNAVEVISKRDDALDLEQSKWDDYLDTGDVSKLVFKPGLQPTIFLCNFELTAEKAKMIKNAVTGGSDDEGKPSIQLGSWSFAVAKNTLKDIKNPEDVPEPEQFKMKKDHRGLVHDDLLGELDSHGFVDDIFLMYTKLSAKGVKSEAKN
jgi:hypothetical protein